MRSSAAFLNASEAAERLGVSVKALRLYERRGLLAPVRTAAGWRAYGPGEMARAAEIAGLRGLGLSLAEVASVVDGGARRLEPALATHEATLEGRIRQLSSLLAKVRDMRAGLVPGRAPTGPGVVLDLPWPWGGERFELADIRPLTYIVGPLGSGKTRLARRLAETLPGAAFLGLDRLAAEGTAARARLDADLALRARVEATLAALVEDGATISEALLALLAGLYAEGPTLLVVDMIEQGLDHASQAALVAHLRRQAPKGRPLILLTRSSAILDLGAVGPHEAILLCPANHSPPTRVAAHPGAPGYEAVATCLASPEVRARTEGVVAWRPQVA